MSAWICSPLHIKALAIFATNLTGHVFGRHTKTADGEWIKTQVKEFPLVYLDFEEAQDLSDATTVARILMTENIKSVCHRYDEEEAKYYWQELNVDVSPADKTHFPKLRLTPIQLIKLIHCLNYQSCDHDEWDATLARKILATLEDHLIRTMPGYEEAPWGIEDDYTPTRRRKPSPTTPS